MSSPSTPRPKVNPNSVASTLNDNDDDDDDDDKLDRALAQLLGQSSISDHAYPYQPLQHHHQHCRHRARPQSITSISSLGSGSYSSYSTGAHSRRVSQAYLSPLSPTLSDHSISYFGDCASCHSATCPSRALLERDHLLSPTLEEGEGDNNKHLPSSELSLKDQDQDMAMAHVAAASCTCGSSVRSNSICSVTQEDNNNKSPFGNVLIGEGNRDASLGLGLFQGGPISGTMASATTTSTTLLGSGSRQQHRNSLHEIFDSNRLASLKEIVPTEVRHRLSFHLDECWFVLFSPSGEYLASTGRDHSVLIWKGINTLEPTVHQSIQFQRTVTQIEWSSDSKYLLINLGLDVNSIGLLVPECKVYEIATGEVILTRRHQSDGHDIHVNDVTWFDSTRFVTAPETGSVTVWNIQGNVVHEGDSGDKAVWRLRMIPGQERAICVTSDNSVEIVSFDGTPPKLVDRLSDRPGALAVSENAAYFAITMKGDPSLCRPAQVLVYDMHSLSFIRSMEADTFIDDVFVIMPAFCGPDMEIVCAGSETGKQHFWDIESGELIAVLDEHSQHSGWMSFNTATPGMMASCSDDNHIIIWVTKDLSRSLQDEDDLWIEQHTVISPPLNIKNGW